MKLLLLALLSLAVTVYTEPILYITDLQFEVKSRLEEPKIAGYVDDEGATKSFEFTIKRQDYNYAEPIGQYWVCNLCHIICDRYLG